jgi:hypothetical protein
MDFAQAAALVIIEIIRRTRRSAEYSNMLPAVSPHLEPQRLFTRLARVRRRMHLVALLQGVFALLALLLGGALVVGLLDWRLHMPGLARAVALVGILTGAGIIVLFWLIRPLRQRADNLAIALRLEDQYPHLNDALASAVQFLEQPGEDEDLSSPLLRKIAVRQALRYADGCRFTELVPVRGLLWSGLALAVAVTLAIPPVMRAPLLARTALNRLADPFGNTQWPGQTQLRLLAPDQSPFRQAVGEPLDVVAEVTGVIPERGTLSIWFDGLPPSSQTWVIDKKDDKGRFVAHLEPSRITRSFRFRVHVNDADSGWREVQVLPPPELAPLDGRPSPQIRLEYPRYSDLPPKQLPDGASSFETYVATSVHFRAATNRPIARGWIVYRPDTPVLNTVAALETLGSTQPLETLALAAGGASVWMPLPLTISQGGKQIEAVFTPRISGTYALRIEDETGFGASRLLDIRVQADPPPTLTLTRPSASHDSLSVTLTAKLPLKSQIDDPIFAIRSVALQYRTHRADLPRAVVYYDHETVGRMLPALAQALTGSPGPALPPLRLRPQQLLVNHRLVLSAFRHSDGSPLHEGDVLILQMVGDDFDDVSGVKSPGRSHEVELHIVSPATLEALLNRDESKIRQDLLNVQRWQREARQKAAEALEQKRDTGKLRPEDLDKLLQAEQLQQQVRSRIGNEKEGLRAEVERVRQAQQDNNLTNSPARERMEVATAELERLAREELEPIEPLLTASREESESSKPNEPNLDKSRASLEEAVRHQQEVEQTLAKLLQRLEPWSGANEVRGETRAMLTEQEKVTEQTAELAEQMRPRIGVDRKQLTPQERADLDRTAVQQESLSAQMKQLLDKIESLTQEKEKQERERLTEAEKLEGQAKASEKSSQQESNKGTDREKALRQEAAQLREQAQEKKEAAANLRKEIEALKDSAKLGRQGMESKQQNDSNPKQQNKLDEAGKDIRENLLNNARQRQEEAARTMQKMLDRLEERPTGDLERLSKKLKEMQEKLEDLSDRQERLQKKVKEAQQIADPEKRQKELERLAREQEKLRKEAKDLSQELSRLQAGQASKTLSRAARDMAQAAERFQRGEPGEENQEEALDRIEDAIEQVENAREQAEEQLLREQVLKYTELVKGVRDRQESAIAEAKRLHEAALKNKTWDDAPRKSLGALRDNEENLAEELQNLQKNFESLKVMTKVLDQTRNAMRQGATKIDERLKDINNRPIDEPFDPPLENEMQDGIIFWQQMALRRLDQFLEAIKQDKDSASAGKKPSGGAGQQGGPMVGGGPGGDQISNLAQLKALRSLQAEVNDWTERFAKKHPDLKKLKESEKAELDALQQLEKDVGDLIRDLSVSGEPRGEQP